MRIDVLDLHAYGPFTDTVLDFSAPGVHLVTGPNEAGKSSSLAAITDALFGIGHKTDAAFLHPAGDLEVGVTLRRRDGTTLTMRRLKKRKDDLVRPDGSPVDAAELAAFLGGIDRDGFTTSFGITHARLVKGGEDLLAGRGELGEALFGASSGAANLHAHLKELDLRADELFRPRGKKQRLNAAFEQIASHRRELGEASLCPKEHQRLQDELTRLHALVDLQREQVDEQLRTQQLCAMLRSTLPYLRRRHIAQTTIDDLQGTTHLLRPDLGDELTEIRAALADAAKQAAFAAAEVGRLENQIAAIELPEQLLTREHEWFALRDERSSYLTWVDEHRGLSADIETARAALTDALEQLLPGVTIEDAPGRLPSLTTSAVLDELIGADRDLGPLEGAARAGLDNALAELEQLRERRDEQTALPDAEVLRAALDACQERGDLSAQADEIQAKLRSEHQAAEELRAELGLRGRSLDDIVALVVPSSEVVEAAREALTEAAASVATSADALAGAEAQRHHLLREIADLERIEDPPSLEQLRQQRDRRDAHWRSIRGRWLTTTAGASNRGGEHIDAPKRPNADSASATSNPDGARADADEHVDVPEEPRELADAYETLVRHSDDRADQLYRSAETVARLQQLRVDLDRTEALIEHERARNQTAVDAEEARRREWTARWELVGVEPADPKAMTVWVARHAELLATIAGNRSAEREAGDLTTTIESHLEELRGCLDDAGTILPEMIQLPTAVTRAKGVLRDMEAASEVQRQLANDIDRLEGTEHKAREQLRRLGEQRRQWAQRWADTLHTCGLPADTEPVAARAHLDASDAIRVELTRLAELELRAASVSVSARAFEQQLDALIATLDPPATDVDRLTTLARTVDRLDEAVSDRERSRVLTTDLIERRTQLNQADAAVEGAAGRRDQLLDELGAADIESLLAAIERSDKLRSTLEELARLDGDLAEQSGGRTATELEALLDGRDEARLQSTEADAAKERDRLQSQRDEVQQQLTTVRNELDGHDGSSTAAEIAEQMHQEIAQAAHDTEQYLGLALAALVVREQMATFAARKQEPILSRARPWFARITGGMFTTLDTDLGDDGAMVLEGIRSNGERVGVGAMSEGTRDQLYLALRLAAIAESASTTEPLPLVLDDLLITFDNERARATLEVLADLSTDVQVLLFSHHDHLVDLASDALGDRVVHHQLASRSVPARTRPARSGSATRSEPRSDSERARTADHERGPASSTNDGAGSGSSSGHHAPDSRRPLHAGDDPDTAILAALQTAVAPMGKADLVRVAGIDEASWGPAIKRLVHGGHVTQEGQKRGARYSIVH